MFKNLRKSKNKNADDLTINAVIANGINIVGDIKGTQTLRLDGNVEGTIEMGKGVVLGARARVEGKIKSKIIIVYGKVEGDIDCVELRIKKSGMVSGNIVVENLMIEMGGSYNGNLKMVKDGQVIHEDQRQADSQPQPDNQQPYDHHDNQNQYEDSYRS